MQTNKSIELNLGTFNVPTIGAIVGLALIIYNSGGRQVQQESDITNLKGRFDQLSMDRAAAKVEFTKRLEAIEIKTGTIENMTYRITTAEAGIADVNRRIDRVSDGMQGIRQDVATLATNIEVIKQMINNRLPPQKSELENLPSELGQRARSGG